MCRAKRWAINIRRDDLIDKTPEYLKKNCFVCSKHFEQPMFLNDLRNRLQPTAVPTLVDVPFPPPSVFSSHPKRALCDCSSEAASVHPRKRRRLVSVNISSLSVDLNNDAMSSSTADICSASQSSSTLCVSSITDNQLDVTSELSANDVQTQTPAVLASATPRKERLRKALQSARVVTCRLKRSRQAWKNKYKTLKQSTLKQTSPTRHSDLLASAEKLLTKEGSTFLAAQLHLASKRAKGRRYSAHMKSVALSLYYKGPRAYNFLSGIFALPSKSSLCLWLQRMSVPPGFSNNVLRAVQLRVSELSERNRVCVLLMDEVAVKASLCYDMMNDVVVGHVDLGSYGGRSKPVATSCLVFMVCGIACSWKQPLSYVLTQTGCKADVLQTMLMDCIEKLKSIGLDVAVVISDQGSNFLQLTRLLGVSPKQPYFECSGRKVFLHVRSPTPSKKCKEQLAKI